MRAFIQLTGAMLALMASMVMVGISFLNAIGAW